jgi:hypothetical protein
MPTEIIPSQNLSELPDEKTPSAMPPVYTGGIADGDKFFFENCNGGMMWILFWRAYPSVIPSVFVFFITDRNDD